MSIRAVIASVLISCCSFAANAELRFDGNWWRGLDKASGYYSVIGFLRGADMLASQSPAYICFGQGLEGEVLRNCLDLNTSLLHSKFRKLIAGRAYSQFVDGLNAFYADYRNRSICFNPAISFVIHDINGMGKEEGEKWVSAMRELPVTGNCD